MIKSGVALLLVMFAICQKVDSSKTRSSPEEHQWTHQQLHRRPAATESET
jgi:hypothetical protein